MKKLLSFLSAIFAFIFGSAQADSCDYSIAMHDAWGDGWNGGQVVVVLDGDTTTLEPPAGAGGNVATSDTTTFSVTDGAAMEIWWVSGAWDSEVSFEIYTNLGVPVFAQAAGPSAGQLHTTVAGCTPSTDITEFNNSLSVYPNPNNGDFFITNNGESNNIEIHVFDIQGKEVYNSILNISSAGSEMISLSSLNKGLYILHMNTNKGRTVQNIIIQ